MHIWLKERRIKYVIYQVTWRLKELRRRWREVKSRVSMKGIEEKKWRQGKGGVGEQASKAGAHPCQEQTFLVKLYPERRATSRPNGWPLVALCFIFEFSPELHRLRFHMFFWISILLFRIFDLFLHYFAGVWDIRRVT